MGSLRTWLQLVTGMFIVLFNFVGILQCYGLRFVSCLLVSMFLIHMRCFFHSLVHAVVIGG